jgi:hypothetical protein
MREGWTGTKDQAQHLRKWRNVMQEINVKLQSTVKCVCNEELRQVSIVNDKDGGLVTTVATCPVCQEEARRQAYNKGLENGRKAKE